MRYKTGLLACYCHQHQGCASSQTAGSATARDRSCSTICRVICRKGGGPTGSRLVRGEQHAQRCKWACAATASRSGAAAAHVQTFPDWNVCLRPAGVGCTAAAHDCSAGSPPAPERSAATSSAWSASWPAGRGPPAAQSLAGAADPAGRQGVRVFAFLCAHGGGG